MLWPRGQSALGKLGCAYSACPDEMQQSCDADQAEIGQSPRETSLTSQSKALSTDLPRLLVSMAFREMKAEAHSDIQKQ